VKQGQNRQHAKKYRNSERVQEKRVRDNQPQNTTISCNQRSYLILR